MKRIKTAIQVSEVSFLLFTIKHLYILQPNRQRLPLALETYGKLKEQFSHEEPQAVIFLHGIWRHIKEFGIEGQIPRILHRLVFTCNLLRIDEYVMIDINLPLYLHRQRNLLKQPPPHKLSLSLQRSLLFVPADSL